MTLRTVTFSPTGTTAKIVSAIVSGIMDTIKCESIICDTTCRPAETFVAGPDDITVIAAPVYGGKMAPIAKTRLTAIKGLDSPCVLVAVYGNRAFENALNDMADFATSLGFMPVAAGAFIGEHSYSSPATPIAVGRPDADDIETAREFGRNIGRHLFAGTLARIDTTLLHDRPSPEESLLNFRNFVAGYQKQQAVTPRKFLPEVNTALCSQCGQCIDICPVGAIGDDCLSVDGSKCIKCCACVKRCPANARSLHSPFAPILSQNFDTPKAPVLSL